jgi:hypothetical protein
MVTATFCGDHVGETFMSISLDDVVKFGRSSIITSVGLGVLLVQAAQVRRRELGRAMDGILRTVTVPGGETTPTREEQEPNG